MEIVEEGRSYFFDSVECAIEALEPICEKCKRHIVGRSLDVSRNAKQCDTCSRSKDAFEIDDNRIAVIYH